MTFLRKLLLVFLCFLLILPVAAFAATETEQAIVRDLIAYYFHYRQEAAEEIDNQLQTLSSLNPQEGELWRHVMERWRWINEEMPVNPECLPEGLPEDDSLCIVVLGFGLKDNGGMKPELISRLETALYCADQYPQSYVLCTGGETSRVSGVSEAGQMGKWLRKNGLEEHRLILETESLSTTANAQNSLRILREAYPQVSSVALVTSDYHIPWGYTCFTAEALCREYRNGDAPIEILSNAACETASPERDSMYSQAWGISIIADVPFDGGYVPTLYLEEATEPEPTEPAVQIKTVAAEPVEEPVKKEPLAPVLLGILVIFLLILIPKKRNSGSD